MCSSLLGTKTTVYLITATLMTAELSGMALSKVTSAYAMMEQYEAAYKLGCLKQGSDE